MTAPNKGEGVDLRPLAADVYTMLSVVADMVEFDEFESTDNELRAIYRVAQVMGHFVAGDIDKAVIRQEKARIAREEFEANLAARRASDKRVRHQLALEMREREPALVEAGWTDAELVDLHRLRNAGKA